MINVYSMPITNIHASFCRSKIIMDCLIQSMNTNKVTSVSLAAHFLFNLPNVAYSINQISYFSS